MAMQLRDALKFTTKAYEHIARGKLQEEKDIQEAIGLLKSFKFENFFPLVESELIGKDKSQQKAYVENIFNTIIKYTSYAFDGQMLFFYDYVRILESLTLQKLNKFPQCDANYYLTGAVGAWKVLKNWYDEKIPIEETGEFVNILTEECKINQKEAIVKQIASETFDKPVEIATFLQALHELKYIISIAPEDRNRNTIYKAYFAEFGYRNKTEHDFKSLVSVVNYHLLYDDDKKNKKISSYKDRLK